MKKILIFVCLFLFIPIVKASDVNVYLFHSDSCPHCASEKEYLSSLDGINVKYYEIGTYEKLLLKVEKKLKIKSSGVPVTVVGSDYIVGYSEETKEELNKLISSYRKKDYCDSVELIIKNQDLDECLKQNENIYESSDEKTLSIFGKKIEFNVKTVSLPLISLLMGFIDGFNPCAMWVLIFLITMLINMKDRKKMMILGITFLFVSAFVYFFFMFGVFKIATSRISYIFRYLISIVAIIGGLFNLNSFRKSLKSNVGCQVTKASKRKIIIEKIKKVVGAEKFIYSILGIIVLSISVNFVELACSAGLPAMFIEILSLNKLNTFFTIFYMLLYILMFIIDDAVVFIIAVTTLKIKGISNKYTKYSHLVGGIIMLIIGILMIFKIDWLRFDF